MIKFLKGKLHHELGGSIIIETVSGIGMEVFVPDNSPLYQKLDGEEVMIYTSMIVKEDSMTLYGFSKKESLKLFQQLITVNGVGPKAGLSIMSTLPVNDLKIAIASGDAKTIAKANGVGKKTAERIIIDLKDKMGEIPVTEGISVDVSIPASNSAKEEAVAALMALGYSKTEADNALSKVADDLDVEGYVKAALKNLF